MQLDGMMEDPLEEEIQGCPGQWGGSGNSTGPRPRSLASGSSSGDKNRSIILIRYFRGTDTGLRHQVKERKGEGKWTRGGKCGGTERVEPLTER